MEKNILFAFLSFFLVVLILAMYLVSFASGLVAKNHEPHMPMTMEEKSAAFVLQKDEIISQVIVHGNYACCLAKPCTSCIGLTPWHGEGVSCKCLDDVVEGRYPCGECAGGILAGRGNKFLAPYFAKSIAEGVGEEYISELREIVAEKYNIAINEQL